MDAAAMNGIHSCNYYCERSPCIKAQRDEMRDALFDQQTLAALRCKPLSDEQRITELTENGARLVEAADGWKASAQHFQQKRNDLETQLERQIVQNNRDAERFREALAENSALREDAERYRWFRLQSLWDAERFPWPDGFEYPEGISEDDGAMLDAAIDAARKK